MKKIELHTGLNFILVKSNFLRIVKDGQGNAVKNLGHVMIKIILVYVGENGKGCSSGRSDYTPKPTLLLPRIIILTLVDKYDQMANEKSSVVPERPWQSSGL